MVASVIEELPPLLRPGSIISLVFLFSGDGTRVAMQRRATLYGSVSILQSLRLKRVKHSNSP
jgi:hypothetical protein